MGKKFFLIIFIIFNNSEIFSQNIKYTISGFVSEEISGEPLIGVNIYLSDHSLGTSTNHYGFFSITLSGYNSKSLIVSYVGYKPDTIQINTVVNQDLDIKLIPDNILDEVIVSSNRSDNQPELARMSSVKVRPAEVKNIPALLGEKDLLKVLQLMPGIQKGFEGSSGIYVRGGGPDQNLIILDDAVVYNANHLFGFLSLFNSDALKSIELIKGGFPARYGGRLSSVLDINMKEGNKESWHGEAGIGLVAARMTIEGPIIKDKSSLLISGRRTYADLLIRPFMKNNLKSYNFYDLNAKLNFILNPKDKVYVSGYFGQDKFRMKVKELYSKDDAGFHWGNSTGTLRWNHLYNNKFFSNTSLVYSNYKFGIYDRYKSLTDNKNYYADYYSGIKDLTLKSDLDYLPNPKHWIKSGYSLIYHRFTPHAYVEEEKKDSINKNISKQMEGFEAAYYIEDTWQPLKSIKINLGARMTSFYTEKNQYNFLEPRISIAYILRKNASLKASYSSTSQFVHLISNTGISLPTDLWVPTTDRIKPQTAQQEALGYEKDFKSLGISFSAEAYYKEMQNTITYKEGATFLTFDNPEAASYINWEDNVTSGHSWSYGVELLIRKQVGRLTGWLGYTLSWTEMKFDSVNSGKKFFARYDRRHDLSLVSTYKLNDHIRISSTWIYGSGNAVTLPGSEYFALEQFPGSYSPDNKHPIGFDFFPVGKYYDLSERNNYRIAPYHRLDLSIQFVKSKLKGERIWEISIYNVYNRRNPFYYYNDTKFVNNVQYGILKQVSLFPIIPSISYSYKF